jgi:uncharacterized membrane protein
LDVIIGIDPHKSSHTAVALDPACQVLGKLRVTTGTHQIQRCRSSRSGGRTGGGRSKAPIGGSSPLRWVTPQRRSFRA